MTVIVAAAVGFLAGRLMWLMLRTTWSRPPLLRTNFGGTTLPTAAGVVLTFSLLTIEAGRALAGAVGIGHGASLAGPRVAAVVVVAGFSFFGFLDDLLGDGTTRGFAGHIRALMKGELTTGGLKLAGGIVTSIAGAACVAPHGAATLVIEAAIIALSANLVNLFDLRPGRATKVSVLAFVILALVAAFPTPLVPVAIVVGAAGALLLDDLHERLMLGDTGANALGAAIGLGLVLETGSRGRVITVATLLALNLLSEVMSFTKMFESFGPLRAFDLLGRTRTGTVDLREDPPEDDSPSTSKRARVGGARVRSRSGVSSPAERPFDDDFPSSFAPGSGNERSETPSSSFNPAGRQED